MFPIIFLSHDYLTHSAGATISSVVSDGNGSRPSGAKNLAIEDSGDHECYAPPSSSTDQTTQKGYGDLVRYVRTNALPEIFVDS